MSGVLRLFYRVLRRKLKWRRKDGTGKSFTVLESHPFSKLLLVKHQAFRNLCVGISKIMMEEL